MPFAESHRIDSGLLCWPMMDGRGATHSEVKSPKSIGGQAVSVGSDAVVDMASYIYVADGKKYSSVSTTVAATMRLTKPTGNRIFHSSRIN